ncbi:MAG TPA: MBL fold metallo-hydrolase [Acidimicrobiales bacterium]|nr:MBL fold metallo-hydrolase [Acidimicrobiales bacterium]
MRFTVIGHASLYIETDGPDGEGTGPTILVDPWLFGSCYWRSWWHIAPQEELKPEWLAPDYLYLTHHHFDHFHYPSMRRIDKGTHVLVSKFGVDVMGGEVRSLGFDKVTELPHGEITDLAPGVRVASYQYGFDDTAFVVSDGDEVIADLNDCKIRGRALDQIAYDFGHPTFMFKTHSWAQSYPIGYEAEDPADLALLTRHTYIEDFVDAARQLQPHYAVPFANMVAFLHPESQWVNPHLITPAEVAEEFAGAKGVDHTELTILSPGDSWSASAGFDLRGDDWFGDPEAAIAARMEGHADALAEQAEAEAGVTLSWEAFSAYLEQFLHALPPMMPRVLLKRPVVFEVPSSPEPFWVVDFVHRRVRRAVDPPDDRASLIQINEAVLADAIDKRILHFTHGGMRIHVKLRPGGASGDLAFWGVLMVWEIGYLPVHRLFRPRFLSALWRRRREAYDSVAALRGSGTPLERLAGGFASSEG